MKGEGEVGGVRALPRPVRGLWPQKVRTRLTLIYATLPRSNAWTCTSTRSLTRPRQPETRNCWSG
jgi:hypothetical protein